MKDSVKSEGNIRQRFKLQLTLEQTPIKDIIFTNRTSDRLSLQGITKDLYDTRI